MRRLQPGVQVQRQPGEDEQCRQLSHALHDIKRRGNEERVQNPDGCRDQGNPWDATLLDTNAFEDECREHTENHSVDQVDHEVGSLERHRIGRPVVGIDEECQQGQGPPGRPGSATEHEQPERLPVDDAAIVAQRGYRAEIIEQERAREPRPIGQHGKKQDYRPAHEQQQAVAAPRPGRIDLIRAHFLPEIK